MARGSGDRRCLLGRALAALDPSPAALGRAAPIRPTGRPRPPTQHGGIRRRRRTLVAPARTRGLRRRTGQWAGVRGTGRGGGLAAAGPVGGGGVGALVTRVVPGPLARRGPRPPPPRGPRPGDGGPVRGRHVRRAVRPARSGGPSGRRAAGPDPGRRRGGGRCRSAQPDGRVVGRRPGARRAAPDRPLPRRRPGRAGARRPDAGSESVGPSGRDGLDPPAPPLAGSPAWFMRALAVPQEDIEVTVDGCTIHGLACGQPGRRGLVFVHGGGAHAHWWTHVAATFSTDFRVICLDLSGHGDSGHRNEYSLEQWTDEVMAVAGAGRIDGPPVIIGHSMGGFVTIATAARHADGLSGAIVCDSPVTEPDPEIDAYRLRQAFGRPRIYPTVDDAVAPLPYCPGPGPLSRLRHRPCGPPLGQGRGRRLAVEVRPGGVRPVRRRHPRGGPSLPVAGALPVRPAPLGTRTGHRRHRSLDVRGTGPGHAGHRDPRGRAPRHARPAAHPARPPCARCWPTGTTPNPTGGTPPPPRPRPDRRPPGREGGGAGSVQSVLHCHPRTFGGGPAHGVNHSHVPDPVDESGRLRSGRDRVGPPSDPGALRPTGCRDRSPCRGRSSAHRRS